MSQDFQVVFIMMIPSFCLSFLSSYLSSSVSFDSFLWKFIIIISQSIYFYYDIEYRCLSETEENLSKKTERRQNASQVCTFCSSFGKASWLATWAKTNIYFKNKSSPLNVCKYFKENIPNLCPMAQTSRAEVAQCKV